MCLLICETTTLLKSVSEGRSLDIMLTKKNFKSSPLWLSASAGGEHGQKSHLDGDKETKAPDWGEIILPPHLDKILKNSSFSSGDFP